MYISKPRLIWVVWTVLASVWPLCPWTFTAAQGIAADQTPPAEIRQVLDLQTAAWNRGDLNEFMRYYWRSEQLTFSSGGQVQRGWQATLDGYRRRYPTPERMGRVSFDQLEYQSLGSDAALVLGRWSLSRADGDVGGCFSLVFRRIDGSWLIVHDHTSRDESVGSLPRDDGITEPPSGEVKRPTGNADPTQQSVPLAPGLAATESAPPQLAPVEITLLDQDVIHYATFQSHNQKVVARRSDVFTTHLRSRNDEYTAQSWRLSHSRDRGRSFATLWEETSATNPPALEIDSHGNLYLFRMDFVSGDAYLDRWAAGRVGQTSDELLRDRPLSDRQTTRIPGGAAGKYAALLDEPRGQLYLFSHNNTFHRLRLDGTLIDSRTLLQAGEHAILQYPLLSLDEQGRLHLAWTTQKHGEYLYWDIHRALSTDGGETFQGSIGQPLSLPIVADETGAAPRVSLDDEFEVHTWLASSLGRGNHWHGLYLAQSNPPRQHYVRYDIITGRRELDQQPVFGGATIQLQGLDGFFVADPHNARRLFVIGGQQGRVACVVSDDSGASWRDYARSTETYSLYSLGGYRWTADDGAIVGTFTDQRAPEQTSDAKSRVFFFRIPVPGG